LLPAIEPFKERMNENSKDIPLCAQPELVQRPEGQAEAVSLAEPSKNPRLVVEPSEEGTGNTIELTGDTPAPGSVAPADEPPENAAKVAAPGLVQNRASFTRRFLALALDTGVIASMGSTIAFVGFLLLLQIANATGVEGANLPLGEQIFLSLQGALVFWFTQLMPFFNALTAVLGGGIAHYFTYTLANNVNLNAPGLPQFLAGGILWIILTANCVLSVFYHTLLTASPLKGTLGQRLLNITVVGAGGKGLSIGQSLLRTAIKLVVCVVVSMPLAVLLTRAPLFFVLLLAGITFLDLSKKGRSARSRLEFLLRKACHNFSVLEGGKESFNTLTLSEDENLPAPEKKRLQTHRDHILIRYKPYAAVSRWLEQRFSQTNQWLSLAIVIASFATFWIVAFFCTTTLNALGITPEVFFNILKSPTAAVNALGSGGAVGVASNLVNYVCALLFLLASAILGRFLVLAAYKPSHLRFDDEGIRFQRYNKLTNTYIDTERNRWQDLVHVGMQRISGRSIQGEPTLLLTWNNGRTTRVELSSVPTMDEKALILKAIDRWRKDVTIDAEVITSLEIPPEYSYTEVWLQALCAPPKRERLKPLAEGAILKEGKYTVESKLGAGGQGVAYLVKDHVENKAVVLKEMLLPVFVDMTVRRQALDRFESECRILRALDHDQVVRLIDFFVEDHRAYLVLEYIDGRNLKDEVKLGKTFSIAEVKRLALEMCNILQYLHEQTPPVVHRDFTPDNLMLTKAGALKLIDFNVANQQEETAAGTVVGKQCYMPLEQFQGNPSPQSDIYALGATLYYLLTGLEPEPLTSSHPRESLVSSGLPEEAIDAIDALVAKCTAKNLSERFQNIEDLREALNRLND